MPVTTPARERGRTTRRNVPSREAPERRGGLEERPVDGRERGRERLDREREAVEDRGDEKPLEREGEPSAEEGLDGAADRSVRAEEEKDVEAEDGGGEDDRKGDDGLDERLPPGGREREPGGQRKAERDQNGRRGDRELQAEEEGRDVDAQRAPRGPGAGARTGGALARGLGGTGRDYHARGTRPAGGGVNLVVDSGRPADVAFLM